jgi:hypothetical protein
MQKIERPDKSWIGKFGETIGIQVMTPQQIESARRHFCNEKAVEHFFAKFAGELDRDRLLILNADETHISSRKQFKVLAPGGHVGLRGCKEKLPHFSGMCTVSASGAKFPLVFILPEFVSLPPDLQPLANQAYFISTGTGWMTQRAFLLYVHILLSELRLSRAKIPVALRTKRFLLIVDGHSSRWSFESIDVLRIGDVDVLVLPAHCTHVLQAFDVSLAGPVKSKLAEYCQELVLTFAEFNQLIETQTVPASMGEKRRSLLDAFLNAWDAGACRKNILSGFAKTGIAPLNVQMPLSNSLTRKMYPNELFAVSGSTPNDMNCAMVTDDDRLEILKGKPNKIFVRHEEKLTNLQEQWSELLAESVPSGRFLAGPTGFIFDKQKSVPRFIDITPCARSACQVRRVTAEIVWQIACRLATDLPVLVAVASSQECDAFSHFLETSAIRHAVFQGKQKKKEEHWYAFQTAEVNVCVATAFSLKGINFARRIVTVYPRIPDPQILLHPSPSNALLFFRDDEELSNLRRNGIDIGLLDRSRYDPMGVAT